MSHLVNFELHRGGVGLVPVERPENGGVAIYLAFAPDSKRPLRSCTCAESRRRTCEHLRHLSQGVSQLGELLGGRSWEDFFTASIWYGLAKTAFEGEPIPRADVKVQRVGPNEASVLRILHPDGRELASYYDRSPARLRFLERLGKVAAGNGTIDRAGLLDRLALFQLSRQERLLAEAGMKATRQVWEESFWHRLAYHCVRELHDRGTFRARIDTDSGDFRLLLEGEDNAPMVRLTVPRSRVQATLKLLAARYPEQEDLAIHPIPLQTILRIGRETELDLEVRPVIRFIQQSGPRRLFKELEKFRYGNLVYLKLLGVLAELERPGQERRFKTPRKVRLKRSQVSTASDEARREADEASTFLLEEPLRDFKIFERHDSVDIAAEALDRSWYWLSVDYGFGNQSISLADLLRAKREGLPYLQTSEGWVDMNAPAFRDLDAWLERAEVERGQVRLSAGDLLRLRALDSRPVVVRGDEDRAGILRRLLELQPPTPFESPAGLTSELRPYQALGADWLRFLWSNRLGGLLCDDMGLGKTHQAMALMACLVEQEGAGGPFLVVCPTSVMSHWRNKVAVHAEGLKVVLHHGTERRLGDLSPPGTVVVTSYGILRNDLEELRRIRWALVVFDEIQYLKNRQTLSYRAAAELGAELKIGLTGTPIENSLDELKALLDLTLPGYLPSDDAFSRRYGEGQRLDELRRIIAPFILRRLKSTVLDELPDKIEDQRTCALSEDQIKLYRDAVTTRGRALVDRIRRREEPLPYIHIFALLNVLKQICDHPALALRRLADAAEYTSGKWELFTELLRECLDSGQKVVVFTQYLGMIALMERHLATLGVGWVKLTGASRRRGAIVDRFNEDEDCRVFLGSLKAGGTGIDLVGGSVVIHYDRWWNAAREDQATDRVHRIGQKRSVQVIKLITEGTLEEKIDAIIQGKRALMESVVQEDDPKLAKIFSREELIDLLEDV